MKSSDKSADLIEVRTMAEIRQRITFHGQVQGVGFRYTARRLATSLGLTGWVENKFDGTVLMEVQGREKMIHKLLEALNRDSFIRIEWMDTENIPVVEETDFSIKQGRWG